MPTNKATSHEEAERIIADYKSSGLTRRQYCDQHNLKIGTFHWWMKRHNDAQKEKDTAKSSFIPLTRHSLSLTENVDSAFDLIVDFSSGTRLKWHGKTLPTSLTQLISLLHG